MGYIEANLLSDEELVHKVRLHWIIFIKPLALLVLGLICLVVLPLLGILVLCVAAVVAVPVLVQYFTSEFGVTNKRVVIKVGLIRRRTVELLLRHVEAISVDQSVTGRVLGFGTVTLTGTGGVKELFHNVTAPLEFRRRIQGEAD